MGHFRVPKCKTFLVKMRFIFMRIKNLFHINGFALSLALKQRLGTTPKCPINLSQSLALELSNKTWNHLVITCMFLWVRSFPKNTFRASLTKNNRYIFSVPTFGLILLPELTDI